VRCLQACAAAARRPKAAAPSARPAREPRIWPRCSGCQPRSAPAAFGCMPDAARVLHGLRGCTARRCTALCSCPCRRYARAAAVAVEERASECCSRAQDAARERRRMPSRCHAAFVAVQNGMHLCDTIRPMKKMTVPLRGQSQGPVWGCFGGPYIGTYCWLGVVGRSYRLERYPKHPPRAAACSFWVGRAMRPLTATERVPAAAL